ncbi:MAG: hypothetical protein ABJH68_14265 [Ilumatobacter sp.]|uniref:hypothetical protein n=1 Tax=Ilumatobacter sp. TaxID=1967498 RepID=UPI003299972F
MESESTSVIERGRALVRDATRSARRRIAERTSLIDPPEVDHARRNAAFGAHRRIGVVHIPKSAGSSVSAALEEALADRTWSPWDFDPAMFGPLRDEPVPPTEIPRVIPDPARLREFDAASGHFALSTMLAGFDAADLVMLLREPRSRLLSHYEYWRGLPANLRSEDSTWSVTAYARELDFDEWLVDPRTAYQTDNVVVRTLLDGHAAIPDDDFIDRRDLASLTAQAVRTAASIGWVDVVERGPAMWDGLAERIDRPLDRPQVNTTERRADLPTNVSAMLSDRAVTALHHSTSGDRAIWTAVARRRGIDDPDLLAETAWYRRMGTTLDAQSTAPALLDRSD